MTISKTLSTRAALLGFALATAAVVCLPAALMPLQRRFYETRFPEYFNSWTNNGSFSMVDTFHMADDPYLYAARIQHAGTHALPGDAYTKENGSRRLVLRDFLTFYTLGWLYRLTGNLPSAWSLGHFVLVFLWVPLLYGLSRRLGAGRNLSLLIAVISTVFEDLTRLPIAPPGEVLRAAAQYMFWLLGSYQYWSGPTRFTRPLFTYPCLFAAALLTLRADEKRTYASAVWSGLAGGALAYVHPDVWAAYGGTMLLFTSYSCFKERRLVRPLVLSLAITSAMSLPWLAVNNTMKDDALLVGVTEGRFFEPLSLIYLAAAALGLRRGRSNRMALWMGFMLVSLVLALNVQMITGWQSSRLMWFCLGNTFAAILLILAVAESLPVKEASFIWLAAGVLLLALPRAFGYSQLHYKTHALPRTQEDAFRWLKANTPRDSVVAALSPMTTIKIPVHTENKTLISVVFPLTSDITLAENSRRINFALALFGVDRERFVRQSMDSSGQWEKKLWLGEVDEDSRERSGAIKRYFCSLDEDVFAPMLAQAERDPGPQDYAVDYLWVGPFERALAPTMPQRRNLSVVYENAAVTILRLRRPALGDKVDLGVIKPLHRPLKP